MRRGPFMDHDGPRGYRRFASARSTALGLQRLTRDAPPAEALAVVRLSAASGRDGHPGAELQGDVSNHNAEKKKDRGNVEAGEWYILRDHKEEDGMAQLMRCKACGFIAEEGTFGDVCPACGVPRKMFEPYTDPISLNRRRILDLDIHPIVVHFPISFAVSAFAVSLFHVIFPEMLDALVTNVLLAVIGVLPLTVIAAFLSGRLDGKTRFRRVKSPLLKKKTAVGIVFFLLSAAAAVSFILGLGNPRAMAVVTVLLAGCFACAYVQGRIGKRLLGALFPG